MFGTRNLFFPVTSGASALEHAGREIGNMIWMQISDVNTDKQQHVVLIMESYSKGEYSREKNNPPQQGE